LRLVSPLEPPRSLVTGVGACLRCCKCARLHCKLALVSEYLVLVVGHVLTDDSFLPESPRWLVSKDRDDEAFAILTKYHAEGDATSVLVQAEMAQIQAIVVGHVPHQGYASPCSHHRIPWSLHSDEW
jgi:hypothetical protein